MCHKLSFYGNVILHLLTTATFQSKTVAKIKLKRKGYDYDNETQMKVMDLLFVDCTSAMSQRKKERKKEERCIYTNAIINTFSSKEKNLVWAYFVIGFLT